MADEPTEIPLDEPESDPDYENMQAEIARLESMLKEDERVPDALPDPEEKMYGMGGVRVEGDMIYSDGDGAGTGSGGDESAFLIASNGLPARVTLSVVGVTNLP
jgi:hypothetical protein